MMQRSNRPISMVIFSCLIAAILTLLPLPRTAAAMMPQWLLLVVLYWVFFSSEMFGVFFSFSLGLLADCLTGTVLGMHGLIFTLLTYVAIKARLSLQRFPIGQQIIVVGLFSFLNLLCQHVIMTIVDHALPIHVVWVSVLTSALAWPVISLVLRRFQWQHEYRL